jgi:hypothetical protein
VWVASSIADPVGRVDGSDKLTFLPLVYFKELLPPTPPCSKRTGVERGVLQLAISTDVLSLFDFRDQRVSSQSWRECLKFTGMRANAQGDDGPSSL